MGSTGQRDGSDSSYEPTKPTELSLIRKCSTPKTRKKARGSQTEQWPGSGVRRNLREGDALLKTTFKALVKDSSQPGILPGGHTTAKGCLCGDSEPSAPGSGLHVHVPFHSTEPIMQE